MTKIFVPHRISTQWDDAIPLLNDNFEKAATSFYDFAPRTSTSGGNGGYIFPNYTLHMIMVVYDRPDYDDYAAFTPKLDLYVDPTVSTGTLSINNTASGSPVTVTAGDRFISNEDVSYLAGDPRARYWVATTSNTIGAGGTGSVSCTAESIGTRYNKTAYTVYTAGSVASSTRRFINIYPTFGGSGGGGVTTYTVTTAGGVDTPTSTKRFPESTLTSAQRSLTASLSHAISVPDSLYTPAGEEPYTDPKLVVTLSILNKDSSPHLYYLDASGTLFSGKT